MNMFCLRHQISWN